MQLDNFFYACYAAMQVCVDIINDSLALLSLFQNLLPVLQKSI